jgi:hypothetical protein
MVAVPVGLRDELLRLFGPSWRLVAVIATVIAVILVLIRRCRRYRAVHEWERPGSKVYLVAAVLRNEPYAVKIGYTAQPLSDRLAELDDTGTVGTLEPLLVLTGDMALERALHRRFAADRIRPDREWFYPSPRLMRFVEGHGRDSGSGSG